MPFIWSFFSTSRGVYVPGSGYRTWALLLHCVDGENFERIGLLVTEHFDSSEVSLRNSLEQRTITII
jgi:hypothetical protein